MNIHDWVPLIRKTTPWEPFCMNLPTSGWRLAWWCPGCDGDGVGGGVGTANAVHRILNSRTIFLFSPKKQNEQKKNVFFRSILQSLCFASDAAVRMYHAVGFVLKNKTQSEFIIKSSIYNKLCYGGRHSNWNERLNDERS